MALHPLNYPMKSISNFELIYVPKYKIYARKKYFHVIRPCFVKLKRLTKMTEDDEWKNDNVILKKSKKANKKKLNRQSAAIQVFENSIDISTKNKSNISSGICEDTFTIQSKDDQLIKTLPDHVCGDSFTIHSKDDQSIKTIPEEKFNNSINEKCTTTAITTTSDIRQVIENDFEVSDPIIDNLPLLLSDPEISSTNSQNETETQPNNDEFISHNNDSEINTSPPHPTTEKSHHNDDESISSYNDPENNPNTQLEETNNEELVSTNNDNSIIENNQSNNLTENAQICDPHTNFNLETSKNDNILMEVQEFKSQQNKKKRKKTVYSRSKRRKMKEPKPELNISDDVLNNEVDEEKIEKSLCAIIEEVVEYVISEVIEEISTNEISRLSQNDAKPLENVNETTQNSDDDEDDIPLINKINKTTTKKQLFNDSYTPPEHTNTNISPVKSIYILLKNIDIHSIVDKRKKDGSLKNATTLKNIIKHQQENKSDSPVKVPINMDVDETLNIETVIEIKENETSEKENEIICPLANRPETPQTPLRDEKPHNHLCDDNDEVEMEISNELLKKIDTSKEKLNFDERLTFIVNEHESFDIDLLAKSRKPFVNLKKIHMNEYSKNNINSDSGIVNNIALKNCDDAENNVSLGEPVSVLKEQNEIEESVIESETKSVDTSMYYFELII